MRRTASPNPARASATTTVTTRASTGVKFREYGEYKELFYNLTLRELRSKYKRSVIGWGWSMINPLANMAVYTIVFSAILHVPPEFGNPSHLNNYALLLLAAMLPFNFFSGSVMESMASLLGNQNLVQKTYFPRELIPAATVASKLVSHLIEMGCLVIAVVAFGNWRALPFIPAVLVTMLCVTAFTMGMALLFSIGNVFYRDIMHFSAILFFIWMFLTPIAYPFYIVGGGLASGGTLSSGQFVNIFGHHISDGTLFKLNPMTDAVLTFQSFLYNGAWPGSAHVATVKILSSGATTTIPVPANVSWGDVAYLAAWAGIMLVIGLKVFRKYESRMPEEL